MDISELVDHSARAIKDAFNSFHLEFKEFGRRSKSRFENRDWHGIQKDATERLNLYKKFIDKIVLDIKKSLGNMTQYRTVWIRIKDRYSELISCRDDLELAETFFNSVTRRIFYTVGVDPYIEFVDSDQRTPTENMGEPIYKSYFLKKGTESLIREILNDYRFNVDYQNLELDAGLVAGIIDAHLQTIWRSNYFDSIELIKPVFYRNKGAYIIGRIRKGSLFVPLVLPLLNIEDGIVVDAVLLTQEEASVIFSFTRSYFHVEVERPRDLINFLRSILPLKRVAELYISIGYNKHGKTELYRDLLRHLESSDDKFQIARGEKGMVMVVFTLPSYDVVFKIIKDRFSYPKTVTRSDVIGRYHLVFNHDRAGRLVDAQEYEHLRFRRDRFSNDLLEELNRVASGSVTITGNDVVIKHLYSERKLIPLNLYVKEAEEEAARDAVLDYGLAIKDLAAANIFPGDTLLKNFGVTRHGRIVFYDYDELCLLTDCNFREIPRARNFDEELEAETWFAVNEKDIFPEEFKTFLGLDGSLREIFTKAHGDLFGVEFWKRMQERIMAGEVTDIFPYKQSRRLSRFLATKDTEVTQRLI
jgi:isocitrate dehydrogenase kinase/phosphatase